MLRGLFGPNTTTYMLRGALEETSATHREISSRVANASVASTKEGFANQLAAAQGAAEEIDLQRERVVQRVDDFQPGAANGCRKIREIGKAQDDFGLDRF